MGQPNIKWRKSDEEALNRALKNFNSKVNRVEKNQPDYVIFQPEKIMGGKRKELIETLQKGTRRDFNRKIKELKRYSQKGAEKIITNKAGVGITKWQLKNMQNELRSINIKRAKARKQIEETPVTDRGKAIKQTRGQMEDRRISEFRPKKFNFEKVQSMRELQKMRESLSTQVASRYSDKRVRLYYRNYIRSIIRSDIPYDLKVSIFHKLKQLTPMQVLNTYYSEEQASVAFSYDPAEARGKGEIINNIWAGVLKD